MLRNFFAVFFFDKKTRVFWFLDHLIKKSVTEYSTDLLNIETFSCQYGWASFTAGFMFLPVATEALSLIGRSFRWLAKDLWTRIPLAVLFVFLFHLFTGMLAQELFPTMDPFNYYTYCVLGLFLILFFPIYLFTTLKGYFALMEEAPAEDGTVSDPVVINMTTSNYHL